MCCGRKKVSRTTGRSKLIKKSVINEKEIKEAEKAQVSELPKQK